MVEKLIRGVATRLIEAVADFNRRHLPAPASGNPFLTGIHTPMTEEITLTTLTVTGTIPAALNGRYLRIGPNPIAADPASYHWFIGDGMVHGIALSNGKALWYRNRWIRSHNIAKALGIEAAPGPRHEFDTVNTNIVPINDQVFALVEAGSYPVALDETLDEQHYDPFGGTLKGSFSAHPHRDQLTGEYHAICYEARDPGTIRHVVVDATGHVTREVPITVNHGPMIHDCAFTARYVVILDLPVTFSMKTLIGGHGFPYRWNPDHPARVGLLKRNGTPADIIWFNVPAAYVFHVANAYDTEDGKVILDLCAYDRMFDDKAYGPEARSRGLERWTLDPLTGRADITIIDSAPQDFPRPDERFFGQSYRYVWTMALPEDQADRFLGATKLFAHDLHTGAREIHEFGAWRYPGEFVFVPDGEDAPQGHGWLIGLVIDMSHETTELVIIDARSFTAPPIARIHIPHRVPPGFHGNWVEMKRKTGLPR